MTSPRADVQLLQGDAAMSSAPRETAIASSLHGIRGLLLDMDGVVVRKGEPLPGAAAAVAALLRQGVPFRLLTNSSLWSRQSLAHQLQAAGIPVQADRIVTALSASAVVARRRWPTRPIYVLAAPDALREFEGQWLLSDAEAALAGADSGTAAGLSASATAGPDTPRDARPVAAVIVGDAGPGFTWERLNTAFRLVRGGARLVAMHRNPWWLTPSGPTLDSGAFVRALEFATGQHALLVGKPARAIFRAGVDSLAAGDAGAGLTGDAVLMVGDDLQTDVAGARRAGLRAALVFTGKHGPDDLETARRRGTSALPDLVAPALGEVLAALDPAIRALD
ncbi:MAG: HAD-IIA family hydrolase [Candidatus Limnocylindrales bacterium]